MSHVCINGRNISRTWLNNNPDARAHVHGVKLCVLILLWQHLHAIAQVRVALAQLERDGIVRRLPGDRYELR